MNNLYICILLAPFVGAQGIHCDSGTMEIGNSSSFTCFFGLFINQTKHAVEIQRYTLQNREQDPVSVASCVWISSEDWSCRVHSGYEYDKQISDRMTIYIPEVTKEHEGRYVCQVVPPKRYEVEDCVWTVTPGRNSGPNASTTTTDSPLLTEKRDCKTNWTGTVIGCVIGVPIVLLVGVFIGYRVQKRRRQQSGNKIYFRANKEETKMVSGVADGIRTL